MNDQNRYFYSSNDSNEKVKLPKNWILSRILCLLLALSIWIYVVNITTQDFEQTFSLIDIDIDGWEQLLERTNLSIVDLEESKVSVTVRGLRSDIAKLSAEDFRAYIDVSNLSEGGKHSVGVSVNLPSSVSLVSRYPESVNVSIDENIERKISIDVELSEYSIDTIYELGDPVIDNSQIVVKGPSEVLNRIKCAKAYINLGTVMTSTVIRTEVVLVDMAGNPINSTYISSDTHSVTVTVPVTMEKNIKLVCDFSANVDSSIYSAVSVTPDVIRIKGDPKILNEIESLVVYTLKGDEKESFTIEFSSDLLSAGVEILTEIKNVDISVELRSDSSTTEDSTDYDLPTDQNGT